MSDALLLATVIFSNLSNVYYFNVLLDKNLTENAIFTFLLANSTQHYYINPANTSCKITNSINCSAIFVVPHGYTFDILEIFANGKSLENYTLSAPIYIPPKITYLRTPSIASYIFLAFLLITTIIFAGNILYYIAYRKEILKR